MKSYMVIVALAALACGYATVVAQVSPPHSMASNSDEARISTTLNVFQTAVQRGDLNSLVAAADHGANLGPANSADSNFYQSLVSYYEQRHRCRGNDIMGGEL